MGAANFVLDENDYLKVKYFINAEKAENLPSFEGDRPERQTVQKFTDDTDDGLDDLPFTV